MFERKLCTAIDLFADGRQEDGSKVIQECIETAKENIRAGRDVLNSYYSWGMALSILDEHEQAILKFEKALSFQPEHELSLWQIVNILFYSMGKTRAAKTILEEKLIRLFPENKTYTDTLKDIEAWIRNAPQSDAE